MEDFVRTYRCDAPGCRSYCEAPASVVAEADNLQNFLESRGWAVAGERHYCPAHVDPATRKEPARGQG